MSRQARRAEQSVAQIDLQEQVRVLTAENERLKDIIAAHGIIVNFAQINERIVDEAGNANFTTGTNSLGTSNAGTEASLTPKDKGCRCRGNCSTRACGCVKKNLLCQERCKCTNKHCRNQEPDKENIGDLNSNGQVKNPGKPRGLFSPDAAGTVDRINGIKLKNISLRYDERYHEGAAEQMAQGSEPSENLRPMSTSPEKLENVSFDPMKPRHNLARSPITQYNKIRPNQTLDVSEIPLPKPTGDEPAVELPPSQELNEAVVDWAKHQAERVHCRKCGRGFYPYRIKKHEASCHNI